MNERTYWHGGINGLSVGDRITPAADRAVLPAAYAAGDEYPCDPTRVYLTSDRRLGMGYASQWCVDGSGTLYRVEPEGEVTEDPDYAGMAVCWTAPAARIVAVEAREVEMTIWEHVRANGRYVRWDDGTPMYDDKGRLTLSTTAAQHGVTVEQVASLGRWVPFEVAALLVEQAVRTGVWPDRETVIDLVDQTYPSATYV